MAELQGNQCFIGDCKAGASESFCACDVCLISYAEGLDFAVARALLPYTDTRTTLRCLEVALFDLLVSEQKYCYDDSTYA